MDKARFACVLLLGCASWVATPPATAADAHAACAGPPSPTVDRALLARPPARAQGIGWVKQVATISSAEARAYHEHGMAYLHGFVWIEAARVQPGAAARSGPGGGLGRPVACGIRHVVYEIRVGRVPDARMKKVDADYAPDSIAGSMIPSAESMGEPELCSGGIHTATTSTLASGYRSAAFIDSSPPCQATPAPADRSCPARAPAAARRRARRDR